MRCKSTLDSKQISVNCYSLPFYSAFDPGYPSESTKKVGHFVGFADSIGDTMTFKILTEDNKVIYRSNVHTAEDQKTQNKHADPPEEKKFIRSRWEEDNTGDTVKSMPGFDPTDLIGRTFLGLPEEDGQ